VETEIYRFGPFTLDVAKQELRSEEQTQIDLSGFPFEILVYLIRNRDRVVPKRELHHKFWNQDLPSDQLDPFDTLASNLIEQHISTAREWLQDDGQTYIKTFRRKGLRFIATVAEAPAVPLNPQPRQPTPTPLVSPAAAKEQSTSGLLPTLSNLYTGSPPPPLPFSGHWRSGTLLSGLFALLWAEAVILEIAYQFDDLGKKALLAAPAVFGWVLAALLSALMADWWRTAKSKAGGLFLSISIVYGSAALLQFALTWILPAAPVTEQVARQPWSAQAAYLKNVVLYFLPMATLYILLPFHFVVALQRELAAKQHKPVLALLTGERKAAAPGAVYLRVGWLAMALFAAALLAVVMTQDLFDHLKPSRYKELFMYLVLGRTLLTFGIALLWLLWYSRTLNEIKLECCLRDAVE
jgi:DNA-binding winged helix-turn-helix (wHTH) protein